MTLTSNYDHEQAGVQMTLSAIAYVDEDKDPLVIKTAIAAELSKKQYATQDNWELVWGPGVKDGNLMYVAKSKLNTNQYALAIRGTDWDFLSNLKEDLWLSQVEYPYSTNPSGTLMVSNGALAGLQNLQRATDPVTGETLEQYLRNLAASFNLDLTVTGHSLGGCLASLALVWLHDMMPVWGINLDKIQLMGYTFAAPTAGNPHFANYFNATVGSRCLRIVNPLDVPPYAWGDLQTLIQKSIPTHVPTWIRLIIDGAIAYLDYKEWHYQQTNTEICLRQVQIPSSVHYLNQAEDQHNSNSYLYLLGAPQIDISPPSPLSNYDKGDVLAFGETRLSPPQYILYNRILSSIGADTTVHIKDIYQKSGIYFIDIYPEDKVKATGLAAVLVNQYNFGGIKVQVRVLGSDGEVVTMTNSVKEFEPIAATKALIEKALMGNPYFVAIKDVPQNPHFPPTLGQLAIVYARQVIQYFSDDISDYYRKSNQVAQNVFQEIMKDQFYETVHVSVTTQPDV